MLYHPRRSLGRALVQRENRKADLRTAERYRQLAEAETDPVKRGIYVNLAKAALMSIKLGR
jgi:hypothetical protein